MKENITRTNAGHTELLIRFAVYSSANTLAIMKPGYSMNIPNIPFSHAKNELRVSLLRRQTIAIGPTSSIISTIR